MIELDTDRKQTNAHDKTIIFLDESDRTNCITVVKILHRGDALKMAVTQSVFASTDNRV